MRTRRHGKVIELLESIGNLLIRQAILVVIQCRFGEDADTELPLAGTFRFGCDSLLRHSPRICSGDRCTE